MSKATQSNHLTPVPQIIRELSPALADAILTQTQADNRESFAAAMTAVGSILKFRPGIWREWPKPRQREWLWKNLPNPRLADAARQLLQEWFFNTRVPMLNAFLDALGIARDSDGYIKETPPETLPKTKVKAGVETLLATHPAPEVTLYLRLFQYGHPKALGWESIAKILTDDPRLCAAEAS